MRGEKGRGREKEELERKKDIRKSEILKVININSRYPQLIEALVVLDSSPERPRKIASPVGDLLSHLMNLDLSTLTSRREADELLRDKIPVSQFLSLSLSQPLSLRTASTSERVSAHKSSS